MTPLLSICIPTFNRAHFLDAAIASIAAQVTPDLVAEVELCISDNASTDDTDAIVAKWRQALPIRLVYSKNRQNEGADANFVKVIAIASGTYCWYLGSDDLLKEGGLAAVVGQLRSNPEVGGLIVRSVGVTLDGCQPVPLPKFIDSVDRHFHDLEGLLLAVGQYMALISALVFRRDEWLAKRQELTRDGRAFSYFAFEHVITVVRMMKAHPDWLLFAKEPVVCWRAANDSFAEEGLLRRYLIDVEGHSRIFLDEFGRFSRIYRELARRAILHWHRGRLHQAKRSDLSLATYLAALRAGLKMYWNIPSFYFLLFSALIPKRIYVLIDEAVISRKQKAATR